MKTITAIIKLIFLSFLPVLLLLIPISGVEAGALRVAASIAPLYDFARQVGGENVQVVLLLPPGASPHTYSPTPGILREVSKTDVYIKIGAGIDFWIDRLIDAQDRKARVVECIRDLDVIESDHRHAGEASHIDPHVWLDPLLSIEIVRKIAKAFSDSDPGHAAAYAENAARYEGKLKELDREIAGSLRDLRQRDIITFHPSFRYFARRYQLNITGVIEESPGKDPSPRHLSALLRTLAQMQRKVIFAEPQFSTRVADAVASEVQAQVLILDPLGDPLHGKGYIETMRGNLSVLEKALK